MVTRQTRRRVSKAREERFVKSLTEARRTIAKSGNTAIEAGDGLDGAEGAAFGSQGHGHP